jgi:hypothetical protein
MDAMMAKMTAYATPVAAHQHLGAMVGKFRCDVKIWMDPAAPPQESTGVMVGAWMLGGRYVSQSYKSEWMGQPFEGFGLMGYDNAAKKYFSTWMDNFATGLFLENGDCDDSGKKFTLTGENFDPELGKKRWTKSTIEVINADKNGKAVKSFEMVATKE